MLRLEGLEAAYGVSQVLFGITLGVNAGQRLPDLVGNVKYSGTWGSAQLSGALHQIRSNAAVGGEYDDRRPELGRHPVAHSGGHLVVGEAHADGARRRHDQPRRSDSQSQHTSPCHRWWSRMWGDVGGTGSSHWVRK